MSTERQKALQKLNDEIQQLVDEQRKDPLKFFKPNPIQQRLDASQKRNRWCFAGNRSGKSFWLCVEAARFARGEHPHRKIETPNIGWVTSTNYKVSEQVVEPTVKYYIGEDNIAGWEKRDKVLTLTNGSKIYFRSADSREGAKAFTSGKIRWAALDEDCPEDIYKEILMRTFDQQGDIWGAVTPMYSTWMHDKIYLNQYKDPEIEVFFGSIYENSDNLPIGEIDRRKGTYTADELETRLYGKFLFFKGLIYKDFKDIVNLIDPFPIPAHWPKYRILDHGLYDPTACLWVAISPENEHFYYREYYKAGENIPTNCYWVKQLSPEDEIIKLSLIDFTTAKRDPVNKKAIIDEYRSAGIKPLRLAPGSLVATRINKVSVGLKNRQIFVFRNLENTIREFKTWCWLKSGKPQRGNDHTLDCIGFFETFAPKYGSVIVSSRMKDIPISPEPDPLKDTGM